MRKSRKGGEKAGRYEISSFGRAYRDKKDKKERAKSGRKEAVPGRAEFLQKEQRGQGKKGDGRETWRAPF